MNKGNTDNHPENSEPDDLVLDQLVLDRLVDDDLSDAEYQRVLRLVEEKPDGWRQLAMAFLESQAFEKEMSAMQAIEAPYLVDAPSLIESSTDQDLERDESEKPSGNAHAIKENRAATGAQPAWEKGNGFGNQLYRALPAIAACFAIAFAGALYLRGIQNQDSSQLSTLGDSRDVNSGGAIDPEYLELVSNDAAGRVQTPVYNHQNFDPRTYAQGVNSLKPGLQEVVSQSGWNANEKTHMVPIKDQTGNKIIVPLKEIKLTPQNFEDYQ